MYSTHFIIRTPKTKELGKTAIVCVCLQRQLGAVNSSHNRTGWFCWHRLNQLIYSRADEVPSRLLEPSRQADLLCASIVDVVEVAAATFLLQYMQHYYFYERQSHKPSFEQIFLHWLRSGLVFHRNVLIVGCRVLIASMCSHYV